MQQQVYRPFVKVAQQYVGFYSDRKIAAHVVQRLNIERRADIVAVRVHFLVEQRRPVQYVFPEIRRKRQIHTHVKAPVRARFHIYGQTTVAERCEVRARRKFVIIIVISVGIYDESAVLQQRQYYAVAYGLERSAVGSRFFDGFFGYRDLQGHVAVLVLVEIQSYAGVA